MWVVCSTYDDNAARVRHDISLTFILAILAADLVVGLMRLRSATNHQLTVTGARLLATEKISFTLTTVV